MVRRFGRTLRWTAPGVLIALVVGCGGPELDDARTEAAV